MLLQRKTERKINRQQIEIYCFADVEKISQNQIEILCSNMLKFNAL